MEKPYNALLNSIYQDSGLLRHIQTLVFKYLKNKILTTIPKRLKWLLFKNNACLLKITIPKGLPLEPDIGVLRENCD